MTQISIVIEVLSYVLPFANQIANILTSSSIKIFENLYRHCIDKYLVPQNILKTIAKKKICDQRDIISKIFIDIIAFTGIIIYISKNAIQFGYLTGILNGINIILFSFILPNLYLFRVIKYIKRYFKLKNKYNTILIGILLIAILIGFTILFEFIIYTYAANIKIDPELEKYIYPRK